MNEKNSSQRVLITGASYGIGYEFSKLFAKAGYHLVLVARSRDKLEKIAEELTNSYGINAMVISKDLSKLSAPAEIVEELKEQAVQIDVLINNAGFGTYGYFKETDLQNELQMMQLNMINLVQLTKLLLPGMLERKKGRILNVGSTGSFASTPTMAIYCATKAFVLSFSEAIAEELQGTGVTVTTLCPGVTVTEFSKRAHTEGNKLSKGITMSASAVAKMGCRALMKGKTTVVTGFFNKFLTQSIRFTPRNLVLKMGKYMMSK